MRAKFVALVVERESETAHAVIALLGARGFEVARVRDGEAAFNALDAARADVVVSELRAPRIDGLAVLRRALERNAATCVVMVGAAADLELGVEAMRLGAADFQARPLHAGRLEAVIRHGLARQELGMRLERAEARLDERFGFERLIGHSRPMARLAEQVRQVAATRATVLLEGESGTGRSVVAQILHHNSARRSGPFVWVSLGTLAQDLIEAELFGHERDGGSALAGRFELADGGTLFLDDVAEAPPAVQLKLLRVLQDRSFERVGGREALKVDVRLVAATRHDLAAEVAAGRFRADLLQRLGAVRIALPPLRERREDIPLLARDMLRELNRRHGRKVTGMTRGVLDRLLAWHWPGNLRELSSTLEGMVAFAGGRRRLEVSDLPAPLRELGGPGGALEISVGMTVEEGERLLIEATLREVGDDKPRAAAMLGIGLRTLYRKLQRYGLR